MSTEVTINDIGNETMNAVEKKSKSMNKVEKVLDNLVLIEGVVLKQCDKDYKGEYIVPDNVIAIEHHAFQDCEELTSIVIPASVTSIGALAFAGCSSLAHISVAADNPYYDSRDNCCAIIESASNKLVVGCKRTIIPEGIIRIGEWAFAGASELEELIIPPSVRIIESWAFSNCYDLKSLYLPDNLFYIGQCAFFECYSLEEISLPESLRIMGDGVFAYCESLEALTIPASVRHIKNRPFSVTESLQYIRVNEGNRFFDSRGNCNALIESATNKLIEGCSNTVLPNTIEEIGDGAFEFSDIYAVIIPESVKKIGKGVFSSCKELSHIVVSRNNPLYDSREDCNAIIDTANNYLLYGCKNTKIPESVTRIEDSAFYGCKDLISIDIPSSVHSVGEHSFAHCKKLEKVYIPDSVGYIHSSAFVGCNDLVLSIPHDCNYTEDEFSKCKKVIRRKKKSLNMQKMMDAS